MLAHDHIQKPEILTTNYYIVLPYNMTVAPVLPFHRNMEVRLLLVSITFLFISACTTAPYDYVKPKHKRVIKNRE